MSYTFKLSRQKKKKNTFVNIILRMQHIKNHSFSSVTNDTGAPPAGDIANCTLTKHRRCSKMSSNENKMI